MTFPLRKIFFLFLIEHLTIYGCGTKEILLNCDVSETHSTKSSCSFTTTTCIIEEFRDVWLNSMKLSFTNAKDENFTAMIFQNCFIPILPKEIFDQFPQLESFDASNTGMTIIKGRSFVNATELTELNLSNNMITEITGQTFIGAAKLKSLNLASNRIVTISTDAFRETINLEYLDLCHNLIQIIHKNDFVTMEQLRNLYLYRNMILNVDPQSFVKNKQLNTLDLTGNVLREVELEIASVRLNRLDLSNCSLDDVTLRKSADVSENITIRYLNLFQNELSNLSEIHVDKGVKLKNLDLSDNHLRSLNIGLDFLSDVTTLKLTKNQLWEISPGFVNALKKLRSLYLDKNVVRLYPNMFKSLSELKVLSLSGNHLKNLNFTTFEGLSNLTQLNLEDNFLSYINYTSITTTFPSLVSFFIDFNLFRCSFIETMVNYVRNTTEGKNIEFSSGGRGKYPICVPDEQPSETNWGWIITGLLISIAIALIIIMRRQIIERFDQVQRQLRSYRNMRESEQGSSRLAEDGDE